MLERLRLRFRRFGPAAGKGLLGSLVLVLPTLLAASEPQHRVDAAAVIAKLACSPAGAAQPLALWQGGVFDAGVRVQTMRRQSLSPHDSDELAKLARSLARRERHHGYAFGVCAGADVWLASLPAPLPWPVREGPELQLPLAVYRKVCSKIHLDYAAYAGGEPVSLHLGPRGELRLPTGEGLVSLTCEPYSPRWLGPRPWFLLPTQGVPERLPLPHADQLKTSRPASLASWINAVRGAEGLAPLLLVEDSSPLSAAAETLALTQRIDHDRSLMAAVKRPLAASIWRAIGENRVQGSTLAELARLVWNSPRHRRLLLDARPTHLALSVKTIPEAGLFAVILFAAQKERRLSKPSLHPQNVRGEMRPTQPL